MSRWWLLGGGRRTFITHQSFVINRTLSSNSVIPPQVLIGQPGRCILNRGVVSVKGPDAAKFINGLCSSDTFKWSNNNNNNTNSDPSIPRGGGYTAFLTPQSRMLYDSFIFCTNDGFLLDCDKRITGDFIFHLKQYKLKSKVTIEDFSQDWAVLASWNQPTTTIIRESLKYGNDALIIPDNRCHWSMSRICIPLSETVKGEGEEEEATKSTILYDFMRMINGIPEGAVEIGRGKAIPMEFNVDLMNGVDLSKGCYMGQELITRTLHRGVVRKRIVPIEIFDCTPGSAFTPDPTRTIEGLEVESDLMQIEPQEAQSILDVTSVQSLHSFGKLVAILGNVGLALVRLDEIPQSGKFVLHRPHLTPGTPTLVLGRTKIPDWWPESLSVKKHQ